MPQGAGGTAALVAGAAVRHSACGAGRRRSALPVEPAYVTPISLRKGHIVPAAAAAATALAAGAAWSTSKRH